MEQPLHSYYVEPDAPPTGRIPVACHVQELCHIGRMVRPHVHNWIELLFCLEGRLTVSVNNRSYPFSAGDLMLINSHAIHAVDTLTDGNHRYVVIKFQPELLYSAVPTATELKYLLPFSMQNSKTQKYFSGTELQGSTVPALVETILRESQQRAFGYELALRLNIQQLFLWILRRWSEQGITLPSLPGSDTGRMAPAFDYVHEHYAQELSVAQMARCCHMSYSSFSRAFRQLTGKTFVQYVHAVRLLHAKMLLIQSELSVTDIALQTGFSTSSYFIEQFRLSEGLTPHQYRRSLNPRPGIRAAARLPEPEKANKNTMRACKPRKNDET